MKISASSLRTLRLKYWLINNLGSGNPALFILSVIIFSIIGNMIINIPFIGDNKGIAYYIMYGLSIWIFIYTFIWPYIHENKSHYTYKLKTNMPTYYLSIAFFCFACLIPYNFIIPNFDVSTFKMIFYICFGFVVGNVSSKFFDISNRLKSRYRYILDYFEYRKMLNFITEHRFLSISEKCDYDITNIKIKAYSEEAADIYKLLDLYKNDKFTLKFIIHLIEQSNIKVDSNLSLKMNGSVSDNPAEIGLNILQNINSFQEKKSLHTLKIDKFFAD